MNAGQRREYINTYVDHDPRREVTREPNDGLVERRTGRKGTVDYSDAALVTLDGTNAALVVPVYWGGWKWSALVWNYRGEFARYVGLRSL